MFALSYNGFAANNKKSKEKVIAHSGIRDERWTETGKFLERGEGKHVARNVVVFFPFKYKQTVKW